MRFILTSAWKDLRRIGRDPLTLLLWMGIPVFIGGLLIAVFGRQPAAPHGLLLIADEDASLISRGVATAFTQDKLGEMFTVEKVKQAEGRRRMARGDASALLVIPNGFAAAVLRNERCRLTLVTNPSQRILPQMLEEVASVVADGAFYVNRIAGDQLRVFADPPPGGAFTYSDAAIMGVSAAMNRLTVSLRKYIDPPLMQLETNAKTGPVQGGLNIPALFFPSMLSLTVLFVAQGLSGDLWHERNGRTLRRIVSTAVPLWQWFSGKLLALTGVFALAGAVGLACARWILGLSISNPTLAAVWITLAGLSLFLFFALLQMLAANERSANLLVNFCFFPIAMVGGIFFPFEMMPAGMAALARRTPIGWALTELRSLISAPAGASHLLSAFALLSLVTAALFALALWRLKRSFAR